MLEENSITPKYALYSTSNNLYSLKDSLRKYVVLYFYPKDNTPGCTIETIDFNNLLIKFRKLNCEIFGISKDPMKSHNKFKEKYKIKFNLLADDNLKIVKSYKVWIKKKFMGRDFMGIARSTFLIDPKGKIIKIWSNVKVENHAQKVLNTLKSLN